MTNEQRESNKLIAEFMGAKYTKGWSESTNPMYHFEIKPSFHPDYWHTFDFQIDHMLYHSSWDWLMPVVDKIESLGFSTHIIHTKSVGSLMHIINYITDVITTKGENKIEVVYTNVVKFIKWFNENKKT